MTIEITTKIFLLVALLWLSGTAIIVTGDILTKALRRVVNIFIRGGKFQGKN